MENALHFVSPLLHKPQYKSMYRIESASADLTEHRPNNNSSVFSSSGSTSTIYVQQYIPLLMRFTSNSIFLLQFFFF